MNGATGEDGLSVKFLREGYKALEAPIDAALNSRFLLRARPDTLNRRVIKLVHKGGKPRNKASSFRPISLQWVFGKQLDSIMNARLLAFGIQMKIITKHHFWFIGVGTTDAVIFLMDCRCIQHQ